MTALAGFATFRTRRPDMTAICAEATSRNLVMSDAKFSSPRSDRRSRLCGSL